MKVKMLIRGVALILAIAVVGLLTAGAKPNDNKSDSRIQKGLAISPVHLNLQGKNRAKVGLGSYLVNAVAGCNDCHTCTSYAPGHAPYIGGDGQINSVNFLAGGVPFGPFPSSANLTPDANGLPAGLTLDEFITTIRTGHDPEGDLLFVMPWPIYRNQNRQDLEAIYAYLTAIPHAEPGICAFAGQ